MNAVREHNLLQHWLRRAGFAEAALCVFSVCVAIASTVTATPTQAADSAGVRLYSSSCASCHGASGEGNVAVRAPALAGLDDAYLLRQLQHFRDGVRGTHADDKEGAVMRAAVAPVNRDNAMREVIEAIKRFPLPVSPIAAAGADLTAGRNYYNGICSSCHGGKAEGILALNSPRLAGQSAEYLLRQFGLFRSKIRGGHANDKYGAQMAKITKAIADDKLAADIAAYIVQLSRKP